ncbi:dolichol-phosphate mannosyltransferase [Myxococcaceae bacterium]|jgi:dolichol-phosphate mannosyltransferase|nr:dolichol-phosphate mannosyltransferase [Myxococcaceae bacterium]
MFSPELSIVVPAYDEERNVPVLAGELRSELSKAGIDAYEVIFVDDGSRDSTAERVRDEVARDPKGRFRLIRLERNSGESAATEAGLRRARGEIVVVMDCDLQNAPSDLVKLVDPVRRGEADCACGWRVDRTAGDTGWRHVQSRIANAVVHWLAGDTIQDAGCTYRAFRRECIERVKVFRGMHRFLPTLFELEGHRVIEVPVESRPRLHGVSKYGMWNRAFAAFYDLLAVRWMRSRVVRWRVAEDSLEAATLSHFRRERGARASDE